MGLKKLEISGFKSFAKRTQIQFSAGINAIVGPNGCGKSNIVDAFLWALGEQSAKTLRGSKMHDVIFAGSEKMKPLHLAEVSITFDNSNKYLPIAYEEVCVTRKLYRDQGSEYLLNKQDVRLKDVQELFAHTGLAHETFAVIGQGRVDKIISQSPEERRTMFEEVAGILHFLIKRKESERKLELCQINVSRAQDILKEVINQKQLLEKQAQDARKFQNDREKLAAFERRLCEVELCRVDALMLELTNEIEKLNRQKSEHDQKDEQIKLALQTKKEALKGLREEVSKQHARKAELQNSQNLFAKEMSYTLEKFQNHNERVQQAKKEQVGLDEQQKRLLNEKECLDKEYAKLVSFQEELQIEYETVEEKFRRALATNTQDEAELKALLTERSRFQNVRLSIEAEQKKTDLAEAVTLDKLKQRKLQLDALNEKQSALLIDLEGKKEVKVRAIELVVVKKESLANLSQGIFALDSQIKIEMKSLDESRRDVLEKEARHKLLEKQLFEMEGFSNASKTLCKEASQVKSNLYQKVVPLLDFIELDKDMPKTFSLIGSLYESTLVVKTISDLEMCLASLTGKVEASFLVLEFLGISCPEPHFTAKEKELLKRHLFDTVDYKDSVQSRPALTTLLAQNRYVDTVGVIFIGREKEHNLLARKKQAKELMHELERSKQALVSKEQAVGLLHQKRAEMQAACSKEDEEMRKLDFEVVSCSFQLQELEKQLAVYVKELERQEAEIKSFTDLLTTLKTQSKSFEEKLKEAAKNYQEAEAALHSKEAMRDAHKKEHAELTDERNKALSKYHEAKTAVQKMAHSLQLHDLQQQDAKKRLLSITQEIESSSKTIMECQSKEKEASHSLERAKSELEKLMAALSEKEQALLVCEKEVIACENGLAALQAKMQEHVASFSAKEVQKEHLVSEQNRFKDALSQMQTYDVAIDSNLAAAQLEEQCRRLRNALERNKNVNLMAIDELEQVILRHDVLVKQLEDLTSAKDELLKIIDELEKESKTAFKDTFEAIREAFRRHFQTLFNGGEADLLLTDGQDLLKSGIEIVAKPPGKQMRSMQLLSGGEKSLTALALLFACFDVRPSPFCILDEVDAALDEANVDRLAKLLQSFAGNLQFLVITHNKRTMAVADVLIGVSMQEKGISQILSLDFQKNEKRQEAHV